MVLSDCRLDNFLNRRAHRAHVPRAVRHRGLLWCPQNPAPHLPDPPKAGGLRLPRVRRITREARKRGFIARAARGE